MRSEASRHHTHLAPDLHLDLGCAPYVLYGVKYIDIVSLELCRHCGGGYRLHRKPDPVNGPPGAKRLLLLLHMHIHMHMHMYANR